MQQQRSCLIKSRVWIVLLGYWNVGFIKKIYTYMYIYVYIYIYIYVYMYICPSIVCPFSCPDAYGTFCSCHQTRISVLYTVPCLSVHLNVRPSVRPMCDYQLAKLLSLLGKLVFDSFSVIFLRKHFPLTNEGWKKVKFSTIFIMMGGSFSTGEHR